MIRPCRQVADQILFCKMHIEIWEEKGSICQHLKIKKGDVDAKSSEVGIKVETDYGTMKKDEFISFD